MNLLNREKEKPKLVPPVPPASVGSLSQEAKFGLLGLLALSLPYDDHAAPRGSWNRRCMECVCEALGLKKSSVHAVEPLVRDTIGWSRPPPKGRNGRLTARSSSKDNLKAAANAAVMLTPEDNAKAGGALPLLSTDSSRSGNLTTSASNNALQVSVGAEAAEAAAAGGQDEIGDHDDDDEARAPASWEGGPFALEDAWEAPEVAAGRSERRAVFEGLLPPLGWSRHNDNYRQRHQRLDGDGGATCQQQPAAAAAGSYIDGLAARHTLLRAALAAVVAGVGYDARARTAMQNLAQAAKVPWAALAWSQQQRISGSSTEWLACVRASEVAVAVVLLHSAAQLDATRARQTQWRVAKVGAAAVGGGALLFVTGGLAAPALAAALAAAGVGSATTITLASSAMIVGSVFGAGGAARAGLAMSRRTAGVQEFAILRVDDRGLLLPAGGNGGNGTAKKNNAPGMRSNLPSMNKTGHSGSSSGSDSSHKVNSPQSPPLLRMAEQSNNGTAVGLKQDDEGQDQLASGQGTSTSSENGDAARVAALLSEEDDDDDAKPSSSSSSFTPSPKSPSSPTKNGWASALKSPFEAPLTKSSDTAESSALPASGSSRASAPTATATIGASAPNPPTADSGAAAAPGLSLTLCVSGWLGDKLDFERPWGVEPEGMSLRERLQRFYFVHNKGHVKKVDALLKDYRSHEDILLNRLQEKYGADPRLPLRSAFVPSSSSFSSTSARPNTSVASASATPSPPEGGAKKEIVAESQEAAAVLAWLEAQAAFKAERKKHASKEQASNKKAGGANNDDDDDYDMYDDLHNSNNDPRGGTSSASGGGLRAVPSFISVPPLASNGTPSLKARLEAWEADQDAERAAELEVNARRAQHAANAEVQAKAGAAAAAATTATSGAAAPTSKPAPPSPSSSSSSLSSTSAAPPMPPVPGISNSSSSSEDPVAVAAAAEEAAAMQKAMERRRLKNGASEQGNPATAAGPTSNAEPTPSSKGSANEQQRSAKDDAEDAIRLVQGAMGSPWPQEQDEEQGEEGGAVEQVSGGGEAGGAHVNPLLRNRGDDDDDENLKDGESDGVQTDAVKALELPLSSGAAPTSNSGNGDDDEGGENNLAVNALVARAAAMGISPANDEATAAASAADTGAATASTALSDQSRNTSALPASNSCSSSGGGLTGTALWPEISGLWFWGDRFGSGVEQYVLRWESDMLIKLGHSLADMAATAAAGAAYTTASMTVSAVSVTAAAVVMPYYLMRSFEFVDPIWTLACERADAAGVLLAETLLERKHGTRPVTLLGFSMGARLIFACLNELGRRHFEWAETRRRKVISAENEARRVVSDNFHAARAKAAKAERAAAADESGSVSSGGSGSGSSGSNKSSGGAGKWSGLFSSFARAGSNNNTTSSSSSVRSSGSGNSRGSGSKERSSSSLLPLTPRELQEVNEAARVAANAAAAALEKEESPVAGLIGDVVLMGTPVSVSPSAWSQARGATCGRLVNAYSTHDWTLYALYRYQRFSSTVAGVRPVSGVAGVENIDVSDFVKAHGDYPHSTGPILDVVQLDDDCLSSSPMGTATQEV